jgi:hypothetical protein
MKTGRLLKFRRPGGDVQAYLYLEKGVFHASVFVLGAAGGGEEPLQTLTGETEAAVERELRAWVAAHYPDRPPQS